MRSTGADGGRQLDENTRRQMESFFGADLGDVRVHSDAHAAQAAASEGAEAFTVGRDIYFGEGKFDPNSAQGKALLGHELTHVLQQRAQAPRRQGFTRGSVEALETEAQTFAGRFETGAAEVKSTGFLVNRYICSYSVNRPATDAETQRLEALSRGALKVCEEILRARYPDLLEGAARTLDTIDVDIDTSLAGHTDEEIIQAWGRRMAAAIAARLSSQSTPTLVAAAGVVLKAPGQGTGQKPATTNITVTTQTFDIEADDLDGAAAALQGLDEWGKTRWNVTYDYGTTDGVATSVTVTAKITVELPRWTTLSKQPRRVQAEWNRMLTALGRHENEHVRIARERISRLAEELSGKPESELADIHARCLQELDALSEAFDQRTDHGKTQGVTLDLNVAAQQRSLASAGATETAEAEAHSVELAMLAGGAAPMLDANVGNVAVSRMLQRSVEGEGERGRRPNLDVGDSGPGVTLLQRLLGASQTGAFDAQTRQAVNRFQRQQGWDPSGVGPMTWERIDNHEGEPGRRPNLVEGDRGPGVALLQRLLGVTPTGYFSASTRKSVDAFQRSQGWEPSGVGPMTWAALERGAAPKAVVTERLTIGGVQVLDQARFQLNDTGFAAAGLGSILGGGTQLATGSATLGATPVAGGAAVRAVKVATDVISKSPELWREARALEQAARAARVVQAGRVATQAAPVAAESAAALGAAGTIAVVGLVWLAEAVIILVLNEAFLSLTRPSRRELPQGGVDAPGAAVPAPATDPDAINPALAPGADGTTPAQAPGKDPATPMTAPGTSDQELELKIPDQIRNLRPNRDWWPVISTVAPDWAQKGAHIKMNDIELAVRPAGPGIVLTPVFSRDVGTEDTRGAIRAANDAIRELGFRQRLFNACVRAIILLRTGDKMERGRAGELRHLLHELEKLGVQ